MDFIEQLPPSSNYSAILIIVNRLTKQALFLPTMDNIMSEEVAQLYFKNVFSRHRVPAQITSDQGTEFISHSFRSLGSLLSIRLHFTSGYHPRANGQTKCRKQTLEQYLHIHCNYQQDDWSNWLPVAEFAYNNAESSATRTTLFFANKGYHPEPPTYPNCLPTSHAAHQFVANLTDVHTRLRKILSVMQQHTQLSTDSAWTPTPILNIGDKGFLHAEFICMTHPSWKLVNKYLSPFEIIGVAGPASFVLQLPDGCTQPPPPAVEVEGEAEHEVAGILD